MSYLDPSVDVLQPEPEPEAAPSAPSFLSKRLGRLALVVGLLIALSGCACLLTSLAVPDVPVKGGADGLLGDLSTMANLAFQLGLVLAAGGFVLWQGWFSAPFHPRRTGCVWSLLVLMLIVGGIISLAGLESLSRAVNTLVMTIPPVLVLAMVGRSMQGKAGSWRDVIGGLVGGGSIGTGLALIVETVLAAVAVGLAVGLGLLPENFSGLSPLLQQTSDPTTMLDPQFLSYILNPSVILLLLLGIAVAAPLIEEFLKTVTVGVVGRWLRPSPARAFLLGVASGAGFALAENLLNSVFVGPLGIMAVFSRLAATFMHCAASGLVGWGWGELWTGRRPGRFLLALVGATGLHGLWNGLAFGIALSGLSVFADGAPDLASMAQGGLMALLLGLGLIFLMISAPIVMLRAGRALAQQEEERVLWRG